jgi:hypothetical protein
MYFHYRIIEIAHSGPPRTLLDEKSESVRNLTQNINQLCALWERFAKRKKTRRQDSPSLKRRVYFIDYLIK